MKIIKCLQLLRISQWLKNLMLLFPPFLGGVMFQKGILCRGIAPIAAFCFASSATYVLNDILDCAKDRNHPSKKMRPIASGVISIPSSIFLIILLSGGAIILAERVSHVFLFFIFAYWTVSSAYSLKFKHIIIADVFCIVGGFLIRLEAGGNAFGVTISDWLFLSVFFLALFLSLGKRLFEKTRLGDDAATHRETLEFYQMSYLEGVMYMTGGALLVTYAMYALTHHFLLYTVPLCTFGLMRYIFVAKSGIVGDPTESLLRDKILFAVGLLWALSVGWEIYGK